MKITKKRIIFAFLAIFIALSLLSVVVSAEDLENGVMLKTETFTVNTEYRQPENVSEVRTGSYTGNIKLYGSGITTYDKTSGYGGELTTIQKSIYNVLVSNYVKNGMCSSNTNAVQCTLPDYTYTTETLSDMYVDVSRAFFAFTYDYPQVFWTKGFSFTYTCYGYENSINITNISIDITLIEKYANAKQDIEKYNTGVASAAEAIKNSASGDSIYDYYLAIHDWMCDHASYNYDELYYPNTYPMAHSSAGILIGDGSVVCQGYAEAFKVLCDYFRTEYNIKLYTALIVGIGNGQDHMWNYAYMSDGKWYAFDVCWDDQEYETCYTYFMAGRNTPGFNNDTTFSNQHIEDNVFDVDGTAEFVYPVISAEKYVMISGVSVTGSIKSYGNSTDAVTVQLLDGFKNIVASDTTTNGKYTLTADAGTYTLVVSKKKHATREYTVTIGSTGVTQNVEIWLIGDVNLDGKVDKKDPILLRTSLNSKVTLPDYVKKCADVNNDGKIDNKDTIKLRLHVKGKKLLW